MAAEELTLNSSTGVPYADGTDGINAYEVPPGHPEMEIYRVTSNESGDYFFSRRFYKVKAFLVQNHGGTKGTGTRDQPKVVLTQGTTTTTAKLTITHTGTREVFSFLLIGEL